MSAPEARGGAPLRSRAFTSFLTAQILTYGALWIQRVATDWLVLKLSGSIATVGFTAAMQFIPIVVLGAYGGVIADRHNRRTLILVCQSASALLCALLATLMITDLIEVWHIYLIALALGTIASVDNPTRAVFVNDLVAPRQLPRAISLNASTFHVGGLLGSGLAGLVIASFDTGAAIVVSVVCYIAVVALVSTIRPRGFSRSAPRRTRSPMSVGTVFRHIRDTPRVMVLFGMLLSVSAFGLNLPLLLAGFAHDVFESGAAGYGALNAAAAVGALLGAFLSSVRMSLTMRAAAIALVGFGGTLILASSVTDQVIFALTLVAVSCMRVCFVVLAESIVQTSTALDMRGRVMSIYMIVLVGGQAIGAPLMGGLASSIGLHTTLLVAGVVPCVTGAVVYLVVRRRGRR